MISAKRQILTETKHIHVNNSPLVAKKEKLQQIENHPPNNETVKLHQLKIIWYGPCHVLHQRGLSIISSVLGSQNRHMASKGIGCHAKVPVLVVLGIMAQSLD